MLVRLFIAHGVLRIYRVGHQEPSSSEASLRAGLMQPRIASHSAPTARGHGSAARNELDGSLTTSQPLFRRSRSRLFSASAFSSSRRRGVRYGLVTAGP